MSQGKKINKKLWYTSFLEALEQSAGNISKTCEAVQVTPQSYYQYRYKDPVFSKKVQHVLDNICLHILRILRDPELCKEMIVYLYSCYET